MKLKTLPSLREKKRYIFFRIHSEGNVKFEEMKNAVMNSIINWLGEKDTGLAKPRIIKNMWNEKEQTGVLKCSHRYADDVKVSLGLVHQIGENRVIIETLKVSGTIKSGCEKLHSSEC